jgi:hypothetical protein
MEFKIQVSIISLSMDVRMINTLKYLLEIRAVFKICLHLVLDVLLIK